MKNIEKYNLTQKILLVTQLLVLNFSFAQNIIEIDGSQFVDVMNTGLEKSDFEKSTKVYVWQKQNSSGFIDSLSRQNIIVPNIRDKNINNIIHRTQYLGNLNSPNASDGVKVFKHIIEYSINDIDTAINSLVLYDFKEEKILILKCSIEEEMQISNLPISTLFEGDYLDSMLLTGQEYKTIKTAFNNSSSQSDSKLVEIDNHNIFLLGKVGSNRNKRFYKIYLLNQSKSKIEFYYGSLNL